MVQAQQDQNEVQKILDARAKILANNSAKDAARGLARAGFGTQKDDEAGLELASFCLGNETFAVSTHLVREIQPLRNQNWTRVPCAPAFIVGAINLRGRIYSLMDILRFWGQPARSISEHAHVILVQGGADTEGAPLELTLLTDELPKVCWIKRDQLLPVPDTVPARIQEFVQGVTPDLMIVLDVERILSDPHLIVAEEV